MAAGAIPIDICPLEQRQRGGELPGAIIIDRNVLRWRLDPTSPDQLPVAADADIRYVLVCNEGYSSRLAAATLRELGLHRATDLVGGFQALLAMLRRTNARPTNAGAARTHSQPMLSPMSTYSVLPPEVGMLTIMA